MNPPKFIWPAEHGGRYAAVFAEIAGRGDLTWERAKKAAEEVSMVLQTTTEEPIYLTIGGYDDDPRELWQISEVVLWMRAFWDCMKELGADADLARFTRETVGMLAHMGLVQGYRAVYTADAPRDLRPLSEGRPPDWKP